MTWDLTLSAEDQGFVGERYDAGAGLQYLNARYYDPQLAMFIQPDWFEVTQAGVGTNRYSYGLNDPVNLADPNGNCPICVAAVVAAGVSYLSGAGPANAPGVGDDPLPNNDSRMVTSIVPMAGAIEAMSEGDIAGAAMEMLPGPRLGKGLNPDAKPRITIRDRRAHHHAIREDVVRQLESQGYKVSKREVSFGSSCGKGRCRPDIIFEAPDGTFGIIEIKTGNAGPSLRQTEIFPQIMNGDAIPRGKVAKRFGLRPDIALKDQVYPNGIPIDIQWFPGIGQ